MLSSIKTRILAFLAKCPFINRLLVSLTEVHSHYYLEIFLTIRAAYSDIFLQSEFICWFRALEDRGKMLIVKPIEPIKPFHRQPRTFRAIEYLVPAERIRLLARLFKSMDFPGRQLKITDTTDQTCVGGPM